MMIYGFIFDIKNDIYGFWNHFNKVILKFFFEVLRSCLNYWNIWGIFGTIFCLGKAKMASEEIDPRPHKYWTSVESLKVYG